MPLSCCSLDNTKSRKLCMAIIYCLFIFAMFADYAAQADYQNRVNKNRNSNSIDFINMKVAGAFFMSLVIIPMILIEGGVCGKCESAGGPMDVICKFFPWIFAIIFVVGGFFYWVGGLLHTDDISKNCKNFVTDIGKKSCNDGALYAFTLPTYVLFYCLVIVADFLKDVLADKKWRMVILNAGLFVFSLFVFCATVDDYGSNNKSVTREGQEAAAAGCFFMWFTCMFVIITQLVTIPQLEAVSKWVEVVFACLIIFGGFLFMCGFFTISAEWSRAARQTNNKDFRDFSTTFAFFFAVWGMFIIAQAIIIGYDLLAPHDLFPCCSADGGSGSTSTTSKGSEATASGGSQASSGPPPPPANANANNNQYGNDGSDAAPPAQSEAPPQNTAYGGSPSMDEGHQAEATR